MKTILLLIALIAVSFASIGLRVDPETNQLIDPQGRARLYHGVNVVYKPYPYYPEYDGTWNQDDSFNEKDVEYLREWGFNHIRLYMAWEGVEPTEGNYNLDYINNIKNIVSLCEKAGIDVLLDFHQDLYSNFFCGEGLPRWLVESVLPEKDQDFPKPWNRDLQRDAEGYPELDDCHKYPFFTYYFSENVNQISQDLITNVNNLAEKMGQFWQFVALQFKDTPNVLGYEVINEPWGMNIWKNPIPSLLPGNQQNQFLFPFYEKINTYIRAADKQSLLFYEPLTWDFINAGFEEAVGNQQLDVLSYHIYCPLVDAEGQPLNPLLCSIFDKFESKGKAKNWRDNGIAGWLTEFGALGDTEEDANELDRLLGNADDVLNSWSYWQYKYFNDITTAAANPDTEGFWNSEGQLQSTKVGALSRAYAYQICGVPIKQSWNRKKQVFNLEVQINRTQCKSDQYTELYLTEAFHYENGFDVAFTNCDSCKLESLGEKSYYRVTGDNQLEDLTNWKIKVTPKK